MGDVEGKVVVDEEIKGAFLESLIRSNAEIKTDRAQSIGEDTEIIYKRMIEDLQLYIKRTKREQENMLDLSPTSADSLVLAKEFDSTSFVEKDIDLGVKIRNAEIKLEIAKKRFNYLFGGI